MGARKDRPPYQPGDIVAGKYAIRCVLGEGGMAVVYGAVDASCDRQVAIKILRPGVAVGPGVSAARVQREAATVVKLRERTPHVVEVLAAGVTDDRHRLPFCVMERLYGASLRRGIDERRALRQPYEILEVAGTATEIATPLACAHELGIVHREVKPENVYFAEQRGGAYIVKLLDFGLSALADGESSAQRAPAFSGSRPYASPGQLGGAASTPSDDVYALGLILYELLTLTLPHDRLNPALSMGQAAVNALQMPVPDLRGARPDIPPRLAILVGRCLAYAPDARPTALQVASMLRDVQRVFERNPLGNEPAPGDDPAQRLAVELPVAWQGSGGPTAEGVSTVVAGDQEVFFRNGAAEPTLPIPQAFVAPSPTPTLAELAGRPVATAALPAPPRGGGAAEITARWVAQPAAPTRPQAAAPDPAIFLPRGSTPPCSTAAPSLESFASKAPPPAPRRALRPVVLAALIAACLMALVTAAVAPGALARRAAARAALSASAPAAGRPSPVPVASRPSQSADAAVTPPVP